jgi:hypothetical protein
VHKECAAFGIAHNHIAVLICASCGCLAATATAADDSSQTPNPWTSSSEWFRPLPHYDDRFMVIDHVWGVSRRFFEDQIPGELIYRVPRSFRNYAAKLLGGSDIIPLSKQQCRSLSCPSDVDRILGELMANRKQQLDLMLEAGHSKHEPIVVDLRTEVEELERWRGRLHPFLAKAVALDESASGPIPRIFWPFDWRHTLDSSRVGRQSSPTNGKLTGGGFLGATTCKHLSRGFDIACGPTPSGPA